MSVASVSSTTDESISPTPPVSSPSPPALIKTSDGDEKERTSQKKMSLASSAIMGKAFAFFAKVERDMELKLNPQQSTSQMAQKLAAKWRSLSFEQRYPYLKMYENCVAVGEKSKAGKVPDQSIVVRYKRPTTSKYASDDRVKKVRMEDINYVESPCAVVRNPVANRQKTWEEGKGIGGFASAITVPTARSASSSTDLGATPSESTMKPSVSASIAAALGFGLDLKIPSLPSPMEANGSNLLTTGQPLKNRLYGSRAQQASPAVKCIATSHITITPGLRDTRKPVLADEYTMSMQQHQQHRQAVSMRNRIENPCPFSSSRDALDMYYTALCEPAFPKPGTDSMPMTPYSANQCYDAYVYLSQPRFRGGLL